jgi:DNA-binding transcriptional LysR family regulator
MDPRQLTYFRVIARHEHMGRAAEELGLSDSALSRSIARLERSCGAELFDRVGRGLRLNHYGRALLKRVDRALSEIDDGEREIREMVQANRSTIRLGFVASLGVHHVPDAVMAFTREHPTAHVALRQGSGNALLAALLAGEIDVYLGTGYDAHASIAWRPLWREHLVALLPRTHPLSAQSWLDVRDIAREPVMTLKHGRTLRRMIDEFARAAGFTPNLVFEGEDPATLVSLATAGFGIALLPECVARANETMVAVRLRLSESRMIGVATRTDRAQAPIVRAFIDGLVRRADPRIIGTRPFAPPRRSSDRRRETACR